MLCSGELGLAACRCGGDGDPSTPLRAGIAATGLASGETQPAGARILSKRRGAARRTKFN